MLAPYWLYPHVPARATPGLSMNKVTTNGYTRFTPSLCTNGYSDIGNKTLHASFQHLRFSDCFGHLVSIGVLQRRVFCRRPAHAATTAPLRHDTTAGTAPLDVCSTAPWSGNIKHQAIPLRRPTAYRYGSDGARTALKSNAANSFIP